jgi:hypothetical protein
MAQINIIRALENKRPGVSRAIKISSNQLYLGLSKGSLFPSQRLRGDGTLGVFRYLVRRFLRHLKRS